MLFSDVELKNLPFSFPVTIERYNSMLTQYVKLHLHRLDTIQRKRKDIYGFHLYSQNPNHEPYADSAHRKKTN